VVTNQGSAPATNVKIVAALEAAEQLVSAVGARVQADEGTLTFEPIANIPPRGRSVIRVTVRAMQEGDARFKVTMTSDQLRRPVEESESTNIYR
jgi:hypothetical protein